MKMAKLRDLKFRTLPVEIGEDTITVRGLSGTEILAVVATYGDLIFDIVNKHYPEGFNRQAGLDVGFLFTILAATAPEALKDIIAHSVNEYNDEGREAAGRLPAYAQLSILEAAVELTFEDASLGETMAAVKRIAGGLREKMRLLNKDRKAPDTSPPSVN